MIIDNSGQVVWFLPLQSEDEYALDFKVQYYQGEPVLTWVTWEEGEVVGGHSLGEYVILDGSYQEIARVRAQNGYEGTITTSSSPRTAPPCLQSTAP